MPASMHPVIGKYLLLQVVGNCGFYARPLSFITSAQVAIVSRLRQKVPAQRYSALLAETVGPVDKYPVAASPSIMPSLLRRESSSPSGFAYAGKTLMIFIADVL